MSDTPPRPPAPSSAPASSTPFAASTARLQRAEPSEIPAAVRQRAASTIPDAIASAAAADPDGRRDELARLLERVRSGLPAAARGIDAFTERGYAAVDSGREPDIAWVKLTLDAEGLNQNYDYLPRPTLLRDYGTARLKPFDSNHIVRAGRSLIDYQDDSPGVQNTIFGVMAEAAVGDAGGRILPPDAIAALDPTDRTDRADPEKLTVVAWAALYRFLFPETVADVVAAAERGTEHVSMRRWLLEWDYLYAGSDGRWHVIDAAAAKRSGVEEAYLNQGTVNGVRPIRRARRVSYGGVATTGNPAQRLSTYHALAG